METPARIGTATGTGNSQFRFHIDSGNVYDNVIVSLQFRDLTLMFGAGNEPSTVEEFEALFPLPYYAYNAGEIISNKTEQVKVVGFNQWDEEWEVGNIATDTGLPVATSEQRIRSKNYCSTFPSCDLFVKGNVRVFLYDSSLNYLGYRDRNNASFTTPSGTAYFKIIVFSATTWL